MAGDFNTKSPEWGDHHEDAKGRALVDWAASLNLILCNHGDKPTFSIVYNGGTSHQGRTSILHSPRNVACNSYVNGRS